MVGARPGGYQNMCTRILRGRASDVVLADSVVVCSFALGTPLYFAALRETICSALQHTAFDIVALVGPDCLIRFPVSLRVHQLRFDAHSGDQRSRCFLAKFRALQQCLEHSDAEIVLYLDADAVLTRPVSARDVHVALAGRSLGMVEQTPPPGSQHSRRFFYDHYCNYTRRWFAAESEPPPLDAFRFFNAGVILGHREGLAQVCAWAVAAIDALGPVHQVGEHMITDQDYFQYWANELHPDSTTLLDWSWNHCEHWHGQFPRRGVRIAHLSNACHGPTRRNILRLRALRTSPVIERTWRHLRNAPLFGAALRRLRGQEQHGA